MKLVAPAALSGTVGTAWAKSGNLVAASDGTPAYRYAVTAGALPAGLTLDPASGVISGTPAAGSAGSYPLTIAATDSAATALQGSVSFTLTIAAGN